MSRDHTPPPQEKAAKARIVAAARELFSTHGFHQTSMADLAKAASVSVGAIYRSFASKSDIIDAIIRADTEELLAELHAQLQAVRDGTMPIETALENLLLHAMQDKQEALTHEILAEGHRNPHVAANIASFCGQSRELFKELARIANPALSGEKLDGVAEVLLACQFGISHRDLAAPPLDETTMAGIAARFVMKALQSA